MKQCRACLEFKEKSEFNKHYGKPDGLQYLCKICTRKASKIHYDENKIRYKQRSSHRRLIFSQMFHEWRATLQCFCGEKDSACLDFHHLNSNEKDVPVTMLLAYGKNKVLKELSKCICVCSNCHRKIHKYGLKNVLDFEIKQENDSLVKSFEVFIINRGGIVDFS